MYKTKIHISTAVLPRYSFINLYIIDTESTMRKVAENSWEGPFFKARAPTCVTRSDTDGPTWVLTKDTVSLK